MAVIPFLGLSDGNGRVQGNGRMQGKKPGMDNQKLHDLIQEVATIIEGRLGFWRIQYEGKELFVITDETHNRMRIMTPVIKEEVLSEQELRLLLAANFDRALDAKYALANDYLWSVFTHPLAELHDEQFLEAMEQVKRLADNYGSSYASTDLVFGGG